LFIVKIIIKRFNNKILTIKKMKHLIFKSVFSLASICLLSLALSTSSCKKNESCHAKITVRDTNGLAVGGAAVRLDAYNANPPGQVKYQGATDKYGRVEFDIKLPAIFDATATSSLFPNMTGKGVVNVDEPGKDAEITVILLN
jgi:hypothetical protein